MRANQRGRHAFAGDQPNTLIASPVDEHWESATAVTAADEAPSVIQTTTRAGYSHRKQTSEERAGRACTRLMPERHQRSAITVNRLYRRRRALRGWNRRTDRP